jgi:DNA polymerase beta
MTVIGIGPSIADDLVAMGVKSIKDLDKKVKQGTIEVSSAIKTGLKFYGKVKAAIPRQEVTEIYKRIKAIVKIPSLEIVICGSYRRQLETSNDIDVLMYHPRYVTRGDVEDSDVLKRVKASLVKYKFLVGHLDHLGKTKYMGFCQYSKHHPVRRIDIRFVPWQSRATALMYFTGSRNFNETLRRHAKTKNMKLNEYGLYMVVSNTKLKRIKTNTEQDIFNALKKPYCAPHERNL